MFPPDLLPGLAEYVMAFWELSSERQLGFGVVGQIPMSAINRWIDDYDIEDAREFRTAIRAMDNVYTSHVSSDRPSELNPNKRGDTPTKSGEVMTGDTFDRIWGDFKPRKDTPRGTRGTGSSKGRT